MSDKNTDPKKSSNDQPQKSDQVPQHKRLAQGDPVSANNSGKGVQPNNA
jgi:hypothetical protein